MATKRKAETESEYQGDSEVEDADEESGDAISRRQFIRKLLHPFGKDQLIELLKDAAAKNPSAIKKILEKAESDPIHRKIFVHGLDRDISSEVLADSFRQYGEIESCNVVMDKASGKSKGFGFVLFRFRSGAQSALKQPQKKIGNRTSSCQLAASGPLQESTSRKIYVAPLRLDVNIDRLRTFFEKFGEIEDMHVERDQDTGKLKGYAFFTYRTAEGFSKALEQPKKIFEGCELNCKKAHENLKIKAPAPTVGSVLHPNDLAFVAPSSLMGLVGQNTTPGLGILQPVATAGFTPTFGTINSSVIGSYSPAALQALGSSPNPNLGVLQPVVASTLGGITGVNSSLIGGYSPAALQALGSSQNPNLGVLQPVGASTLVGITGANSSLIGGYPPAALQALGPSQNPNLGVLLPATSNLGGVSGANSTSFIGGYPPASVQALRSSQNPNLGVLQPVASTPGGISGVNSTSLVRGYSPASLQARGSSQNPTNSSLGRDLKNVRPKLPPFPSR